MLSTDETFAVCLDPEGKGGILDWDVTASVGETDWVILVGTGTTERGYTKSHDETP